MSGLLGASGEAPAAQGIEQERAPDAHQPAQAVFRGQTFGQAAPRGPGRPDRPILFASRR